jgi:hypothetical protein
VRVGAALALLCFLAGCEAAAASGSPCERTSACLEPLVCAGGRCREACADNRDCIAEASCVTFRGAGVCVPPSMPVPCVFNADCGALFCHSGACVAQCTIDHDCERGTCVDGLCSEPAITPSSPLDAGVFPSDASPDQCATAGVTVLEAGRRSVTLDTRGWTDGSPSCGEGTPDGYLAFRLVEPAIVRAQVPYAEDHALGFVEDGCGPSASCGGGPCGGSFGGYDQVVAAFDAGVHWLVVDDGTAEDLVVFFDVFSIGTAHVVGELPSGTISGHLPPGRDGVACGADGAADAYWFVACLDETVTASTCGGTLDTVVALLGDGLACPDAAMPCTGGSSAESFIGAGDIGVVLVQAAAADATGDYTLTMTYTP